VDAARRTNGEGERPAGDGAPRRWRGALDGARIGWIVPSEHHPSAGEAWQDLKAALGGWALAVSEEQKALRLPGGGSIELRSGHDPENLRGTYFDGVVVDECGIQDARVWAVLRPALSDYRGWALLCGNVPADAAGHWFTKLYHLAETPAMRAHGWAAWRRPAWDNPQIGPADLAEAQATLGTRMYLREYGAELVGAEGGVWQEAWFERRYWKELPAGITRAIVVLDAAWTTGIRNDYSAAQVWARTATDYYLIDELHGRWESPALRERVAAFRARWAATFEGELGLTLPLYVEAAGGGLVSVQEFRAACDFPVREHAPKGASKMARNEAVAPLAEAGKVWLPHPSRAPWVRAYLAELVGFPELRHDDRCDATAMALQILRTAVEPYHVALPPRRVVYGDEPGMSWWRASVLRRGGY
jgi:predicted phage terminase large subunit-like protein